MIERGWREERDRRWMREIDAGDDRHARYEREIEERDRGERRGGHAPHSP